MINILLAPATAKTVAAVSKNPGKSWLFIGPEALGKRTCALSLAKKWNHSPHSIISINYSQKSIGIDTIHSLRQSLALKSVDGWRTVILARAEKMTKEAQNAFLKLLEEPPLNTSIIITCTNPMYLAPTIISRCQIVKFLPLPPSQIEHQLKQEYQLNNEAAAKIVKAANFAPGKAVRFIDDQAALDTHLKLHELAEQFLDSKFYEKLRIIGEILRVYSPVQFIQIVLQAVISRKSDLSEAKLRQLLNACEQAFSRLEANANSKIVMYQLAQEVI